MYRKWVVLPLFVFLMAGLLFWVGIPSARAADLQVLGRTACVLNDSGKIYCWRVTYPMSKTNNYKDPADGLSPEHIYNPAPDVRFAQLVDTRRAVSRDGVLWQLKQGNTPTAPYSYNYLPGEVRWKKVANGDPTCGINQDDEILCFGWNIPEPKQESKEPVPMGLTGEYQDIATAGFNKYAMGTVCGIKQRDGSIWCAGKNGRYDHSPKLRGTDEFYEMLGTKVPTRVKVEGRFKKLFGGSTFCAHREDDTLWCWGGSEDAVLPTQALPGKYKFITKPQYYDDPQVLLDEKGSIWIRGRAVDFRFEGYLGRDAQGERIPIPLTNIPGTSGFTQVALDLDILVGRKADGSVWQWDGRAGYAMYCNPACKNLDKPYRVPVPND